MRTEKSFGKIGVLLGGESAEREISLKSGRAVIAALRAGGENVSSLGETEPIKPSLAGWEVDCAFIALHGRFGEDGEVQKLLEEKGIPYTGSGIAASRRAMDKEISRRIFQEASLPVPEYRVVGSDEEEISPPPFGFPAVVKPVGEGSSIGLNIVFSPEQYRRAVREAQKHGDRIILERYIPGRELTVGILDERALPVVEIVPRNRFFDFEAKYSKGMSDFRVPAPLEERLTHRIQTTALAAHRALGCYGYSRVDIILGGDDIPYLLEINTIPGFTETSLFPMAAAAAGIGFAKLCLILLDLAYRRSNKDSHHNPKTAKETKINNEEAHL